MNSVGWRRFKSIFFSAKIQKCSKFSNFLKISLCPKLPDLESRLTPDPNWLKIDSVSHVSFTRDVDGKNVDDSNKTKQMANWVDFDSRFFQIDDTLWILIVYRSGAKNNPKSKNPASDYGFWISSNAIKLNTEIFEQKKVTKNGKFHVMDFFIISIGPWSSSMRQADIVHVYTICNTVYSFVFAAELNYNLWLQ